MIYKFYLNFQNLIIYFRTDKMREMGYMNMLIKMIMKTSIFTKKQKNNRCLKETKQDASEHLQDLQSTSIGFKHIIKLFQIYSLLIVGCNLVLIVEIILKAFIKRSNRVEVITKS